MSESYKKTLIQPKVRLLLRIYLKGFPKTTEKRKKLMDELRIEKGNLATYMTSLLDEGLVVSLNPNKIDPPYKVTNEGKKFLGPIIFTYKIGFFVLSWVGLWAAVYYFLYSGQPAILASVFLPLILFSFVSIALILMFYPYLLLKAGRIHY